MLEDFAALVQTVEALRKKTNTALGHLPARDARRVVDRLGAERHATNRLVDSLLYEIHRHD